MAICAGIVPVIVLFYRHVVHANATTVALTFLLAVLLVSTRQLWRRATLLCETMARPGDVDRLRVKLDDLASLRG